MKTYKNLLEKDYNYLDDIKRIVYKIIDNQSGVLYPIRYNPNLIVTIDSYYANRLEGFVTIINILVKNYALGKNDVENFYIKDAVIIYQNKMLDCIKECQSEILTAIDKEKKHV